MQKRYFYNMDLKVGIEGMQQSYHTCGLFSNCLTGQYTLCKHFEPHPHAITFNSVSSTSDLFKNGALMTKTSESAELAGLLDINLL